MNTEDKENGYTYGNDTFWGIVLFLVIISILCIYLLSFLFFVRIFGEENHVNVALVYMLIMFAFNVYLILKKK